LEARLDLAQAEIDYLRDRLREEGGRPTQSHIPEGAAGMANNIRANGSDEGTGPN